MKTKEEADEAARSFLFSGLPVAKADEDGELINTVLARIRTIIHQHQSEINAAVKDYMGTEDIDAFVLALLPAHYEIRYKAYAPHWLSHCKPVDDHDNDAEFTYYNDLIDMYWAWKWQEWKKKNEWCVTIMLPPTRGLVMLAYQEDMKSLTEYLGKQAKEAKTALRKPSAAEKTGHTTRKAGE